MRKKLKSKPKLSAPTPKRLCDCSPTCLKMIAESSIRRHRRLGTSFFSHLVLQKWGGVGSFLTFFLSFFLFSSFFSAKQAAAKGKARSETETPGDDFGAPSSPRQHHMNWDAHDDAWNDDGPYPRHNSYSPYQSNSEEAGPSNRQEALRDPLDAFAGVGFFSGLDPDSDSEVNWSSRHPPRTSPSPRSPVPMNLDDPSEGDDFSDPSHSSNSSNSSDSSASDNSRRL